MKPRKLFPALGLFLLASAAQSADGSREPAAPAFASKPTAPIGIASELSGEPLVGQPLEVTLTISTEVELSAAVLTLGVDDPLALIEPAAEVALGTAVPGMPIDIVVTVLPLVAETQYLRVAVSGESGGEPQLRSVSVAIRFEDARTDKDAADSAGPAESVQSMQAIETVR